MAKTGRPLAGAAVRSLPVTFRLTEGEYHWLQGLAFKHGGSISDVVRSLVLAGMPAEAPAENGSDEGDRVTKFLAGRPWGR
jgi:hypothetical protein